jgi:hypothetical protein
VRVALVAGSRVVVGSFPDDVRLLLPPRPAEGIGSVEGAVRDALRFPLDGPPLEEAVPAGARVTIVLDAASLPVPSPSPDPRQAALTAVLEELGQIGVPSAQTTILVAGGLARRLGRAELEARVSPALARRFEGRAAVHDVERPDLVLLAEHEGEPLAVAPELLETDAVIVITSAETTDDGGPSALLAASSARAIRTVAGTETLLEANDAAWHRAQHLERALAGRVPILGVSLALGNPTWSGLLHGYPYRRVRVTGLARSPVVRAFGLFPSAARRRALLDLKPETAVLAILAGPPSVAHAEALLRGIELRRIDVDEPLDALVVGIPPLTPTLPRERQNPLSAAYLGLGLALRLWRGAPPVVSGGTLVLPHRLHRRFTHPTQAPYRAFFAALRTGEGREPGNLRAAERAAAADPVALAAYRDGRSCHPLLPFAEWEGCAPARRRLGAVLIAGCRDATAARLLGFVPVRTLGAALALVSGRSGHDAAVGCLPTPPFAPLVLAGSEER